MQLRLTTCKDLIMNKVLILTTLISTLLFSVEIPTEHAQKHTFGKSVELNSKVIQLSNSKQAIMALISGHIEKYYVEPGQKVKTGQKIALIESIELSKMTANYISLKKQFSALNKNYLATKSLYEKGMTSIQDVNLQSIQRNAMFSQISALESQLKTLGINSSTLEKASADYILHAHSEGRVSELLQALHSVIGEDTPVVSIVKDQAFYIQSYLPLEYADVVKIGQKIVINHNKKDVVTHITQVLPELDEKTQRIVVLSSINEKVDDLYINTYVASILYFDAAQDHVAVRKSALSFFNNEWVVFIPIEKHEEEPDVHEDEHENGEDEHGEHEENEAPYEARVVEIITQDDAYVAVKGIKSGEEYVSAKSYYAKSMMLKSSLGEHGH
jgi:membrane fusion protein, heavy metal efflux system